MISIVNKYNNFELIVIVVNFGKGSKVIELAKKKKVSGGTIILGRGTVKNKFLELLDINEIRKEIVLMVCSSDSVKKVMDDIVDKFKFNKKDNGIAFTIPVNDYIGGKEEVFQNENIEEEEGLFMYNSIFIIVDKGKGDIVMDIAIEAGAKGGTKISARGSGIHETEMLFNFPIEPEKDIILILSEKKQTDIIVSMIRKSLDIDKEGKGIIFVQDVKRAYGIDKD